MTRRQFSTANLKLTMAAPTPAPTSPAAPVPSLNVESQLAPGSSSNQSTASGTKDSETAYNLRLVKLYELSTSSSTAAKHSYKSFENLSRFNLNVLQDELVQLDSRFRDPSENMTRSDVARLREVLREYRMFQVR